MNQAAPKTIHLPRATDAPVMQDLKKLSETAADNAGARVELTWSMPRSTKSFRLSVRRDQSEDEAATELWILREIDGPEAHEVWRTETSDITVVRDACYKHSGPPTAAKSTQAKKSGTSASAKSNQTKSPAAKKPEETANDTRKTATESPKSDKNQANTPSGTQGTAKDLARTSEQTVASAESQSEISHSSPTSTAVSSPPPQQTANTTAPHGDEILEEDLPETGGAPKAPGSETIESLTETLHELMDLEVDFDINEVDVPPAVANESAPKIEIPNSELAAVERMRKIIQARKSVAAMREMKADLKLPLISKDPQVQSKPGSQFASSAQDLEETPISSTAEVTAQEEDDDEDYADDQSLSADDKEIFEPFGEDGAGARLLDNQLISAKTAFYTAPAFFKFLEHEFYRFETNRTPFSLIIFEMYHPLEISTQAATAAALRTGLVKRKLDIIGHFGHDEYAILLPDCLGTTAALIASRVHDALTASPLAEHFDNSSIEYSFGIANLPSNGEDIPSLINAARSAKEHAKKTNGSIVLARSIT